jgi:hypothetical protein
MIELVPYMKINCDAACADAGCDACGVELNPWHAYTIQAAQEALGTPLIPDVASSEMVTPCTEFEPAELGALASTAITGGTFGWWYDAAVPDVSDGAAGFIMRSMTLQDPMSFTASRQEQLRSRVCLLPGLVLGEMVVEVVGTDVRSSKWLARQVKSRLEGIPSTCFTTIDVYADCCVVADGDTGLRKLTDVGEFFVEELSDQTASKYGTLISILFSANAMMEMPDGTLTSGAAGAMGNALADYSNTTSVNITEYASKTFYQADLELQSDGTLKVCPVDYSALDALTDFLTIREVRAADAVTNPCGVEIDLDLTGVIPVVTPLQPDLWTTLITDSLTATGDIDCTNPPIVRSVTVRNPDFLPGCSTCPTGAQQRVCADNAGLVVGSLGTIDWAASGIDRTAQYVFDGDPANNDPALDKILQYWQCLGLTAESDTFGTFVEGLSLRKMWDLAGYYQEADEDVISTPDGSSSVATTVDGVGITIDNGGHTRIVVGADTAGVINPINVNYVITYYDMPGLNAENALSVNTEVCGPGDAEYLGGIDNDLYWSNKMSTNGTVTKLTGTTSPSSGDYDITEWSLPDLTPTVFLSFVGPGILPPITAMHHADNEPWTIQRKVVADPTPSAFSSLDYELWEGVTLAATIQGNTDIGYAADPIYDIANDRMLILAVGALGSSVYPNLLDQVTIYEWGAGGILTVLEQNPMTDYFASPQTPQIRKSIAGPFGGIFFNFEWTGAQPADQMWYWEETAGFTEHITELYDSSSGGGPTGMTPAGTFQYLSLDTWGDIITAEETDLSTFDQENVFCSPLLEGYSEAYSNAGMGSDFIRGFAGVDGDADSFAEIHIYVTNFTPRDLDPCGDVGGSHCLPYVKVSPSQSGPCVNITLNSAGAAISDINPLVNDLTRARFEFGPCSAISTPGCPGVIPPEPVVTVNTTTGLATAVGWSPGFEWPSSSEGPQYTVSEIDTVDNDASGVATVVPTDVIAVPTLGCTPPCAVPPIIYSTVIDPDCWIQSVSQTIDMYTITGLSPTTRYRPEWSVDAQAAMVQPQVFLWYGLAADPGPTLGTIAAFLGSKTTPTRIKALELNQVISLSSSGLRITCGAGETADALTEGWVDATDVWTTPEICGAETAYLLVARTIAETQPTVIFEVVPIGTP